MTAQWWAWWSQKSSHCFAPLIGGYDDDDDTKDDNDDVEESGDNDDDKEWNDVWVVWKRVRVNKIKMTLIKLLKLLECQENHTRREYEDNILLNRQ